MVFHLETRGIIDHVSTPKLLHPSQRVSRGPCEGRRSQGHVPCDPSFLLPSIQFILVEFKSVLSQWKDYFVLDIT